MVVERTLIKIHIGGITAGGIEHLGEPEHIVGVAGLRTLLACKHGAEVVGRMEVLRDAVAAYADAAVIYHRLPEEGGGIAPLPIAFDVSYAFVAYNLGYLGVGVHSGKTVLRLEQRLEQGLLAEPVGQFQVSRVTGNGCSIGENLVQSSLLAAQHFLDLGIAQTLDGFIHPVGEFEKHFLRVFPSGLNIRVTKAGVGLMDIVKRDPAVIQPE